MSSINKELMLEVANSIRVNPSRFQMDEWFSGTSSCSIQDDIEEFQHDCNTAACIAGWTLSEGHKKDKTRIQKLISEGNTKSDIATILLFNGDSSWNWLYHDDKWPDKWEKKYYHVEYKDRATVAADLLEAIAANPDSFRSHTEG